MPKVSIIILNWNGKPLLKECLDSLARQTFTDFETVLLDNGSSDGSTEYLRQHYPWVHLVALPENIGFAGGNNRAFQDCSGEFIVALNNDTKLEPTALAALVAAAEADPGVGMVAAKMVNFYQTGRIDSVGIGVAGNGMGHNIGVGEQDQGQYDVAAEVFGPCGGAALYRRSMLEKVGFFDSDFFAYYEDLDLAWRGRLAGWRGVTAPAAVVHHVHSATSGKMSPFTVYHVQRNKWFVLIKDWPALLLLRFLPKIVLFDLAALLLAILRGRGGAALRARRDVIRNLPRLLAQRKAIQRVRRIDVADAQALFRKSEGALATFRRKMRDR
ncbi:glycosyltransferase family 2 protein [Geomonas propionica]|uniref:Glycosyltransferase family 2 protein n=1 Tax=Geomonas propionica TaxID=2798582 RepID=A0ABS0YX09_9BACT|nr:glycosyltransferase family 2 protein [Geomonas propionica]MBJ6802446.1 glycosyltransferase family 2 protein [Geomonas propionica]